jgi:ATP-dependent RNA helicase DeaD
VATDVAARGIDLPNLDLVIHADMPNDAEVMQHRSGRTGRAGRKGVSVLLVPSAKKRRAELLLNLAGVDAVWGTAPTAEEIRKLDQERMLRDALFTEETTAEDLTLAKAMLAERSAEDIAAALARLYRARLPSPEDILDPGQGASRSRDFGGREKDGRTSRPDERAAGPRSKNGKASSRHGMAEGSVWFRAAIGRRKNAEARWLLPMICRRGGIDKHDIGAIRIMDTTTEFEISERVAESFAAKIRRPDKEDNIRIEALAEAPQTQPRAEKPSHPPRRESGNQTDEFRDARGSRQHGKPRSESGSKASFDPGFKKKKRSRDETIYAGHPLLAGVNHTKPAFGKKAKQKRRG